MRKKQLFILITYCYEFRHIQSSYLSKGKEREGGGTRKILQNKEVKASKKNREKYHMIQDI